MGVGGWEVQTIMCKIGSRIELNISKLGHTVSDLLSLERL